MVIHYALNLEWIVYQNKPYVDIRHLCLRFKPLTPSKILHICLNFVDGSGNATPPATTLAVCSCTLIIINNIINIIVIICHCKQNLIPRHMY